MADREFDGATLHSCSTALGYFTESSSDDLVLENQYDAFLKMLLVLIERRSREARLLIEGHKISWRVSVKVVSAPLGFTIVFIQKYLELPPGDYAVLTKDPLPLQSQNLPFINR